MAKHAGEEESFEDAVRRSTQRNTTGKYLYGKHGVTPGAQYDWQHSVWPPRFRDYGLEDRW